MKAAVIQQLSELNKEFYRVTARDFSATREQAWEGWKQLLPYLKGDSFLDIGCGNGRFAEFLSKKFPEKSLTYLGIDADATLLENAQKRCALLPNITATFQQTDIIEATLSQSWPIHQQFSTITLFGVLHHIPSFELREKLLTTLVNQLQPKGYLIFTAWQFDGLTNLFSRKTEPSSLHIDPNDLEPNDYFLNWERGTAATRYCHLIDQKEIFDLTKNLDGEDVTAFLADGKNHQTNIYTIFQKV